MTSTNNSTVSPRFATLCTKRNNVCAKQNNVIEEEFDDLDTQFNGREKRIYTMIYPKNARFEGIYACTDPAEVLKTVNSVK